MNGAISYGLSSFNVGGSGAFGNGLRAGITSFANSTLDFSEDGWKIGIRNDNNWGDRFASGIAAGAASAVTSRLAGKDESGDAVGTKRSVFTTGITTDEYLGHLAYNSINSGLLSAYNMARYDMSWSEASTTTGFYSGMNYSVSELGGFAGSALAEATGRADIGRQKINEEKRKAQEAAEKAEEAAKRNGETSQAGEGFINALGAGLIRIKNDLAGLWNSLKGIGESLGNLVTGKGFNTQAELDQRKAELLAEYDRVKDMTLLAGNGDANMPNVVEAAIEQNRLLEEIKKIDPDAAEAAYSSSTSGKLEAAKKEALLKREVAAAMNEFDKMNENGEMTSKFIEIKNDGQSIIKKNGSGTAAVEYSFNESGEMAGCKLYTNAEVSTAGVFEAMNTKDKKSLDYNTLNLYSDAALILWKDTVGAKSYQSETGFVQNLIQNTITNAAVKMKEDDGALKSLMNLGKSAGKQTASDSGLIGLFKEIWGQSSVGEKAVYIGVGSAVGLAVMNEVVETIYGIKKAKADEGEPTDASMKVNAKKFSVQMTKTDEEKFLEAEVKIKNYTGKVILSKNVQTVSLGADYSENSFTAGIEKNNKSYTASFEVEQSIIVDKNYINKVIVGLGFSNTFNGYNKGANVIPKVSVKGEIAGFHYDFGGQYKVTDKKKENNEGSFFFNMSKKIWKWN